MDIFLHSNKEWKGPAFLYPLTEYRFDGIHWLSKPGMTITITVILSYYLFRKIKLMNLLINCHKFKV